MPQTPASLLEALCRQPEPPHWERFVKLFTPLLSCWARRLGVPSDDVEDVLQEVFLLLVGKLRGFHYDPCGSFRAWLWTVLRHHVLAWRKRRPRALPLSDEQLAALASPDDVAEASAEEYRRSLLDRAMRLVQTDVSEKTWRAFRAVALEGRPGVEVARELEMTANAVWLARSHVTARLREMLQDLDS